MPHFECGAFNHSATSPGGCDRGQGGPSQSSRLLSKRERRNKRGAEPCSARPFTAAMASRGGGRSGDRIETHVPDPDQPAWRRRRSLARYRRTRSPCKSERGATVDPTPSTARIGRWFKMLGTEITDLDADVLNRGENAAAVQGTGGSHGFSRVHSSRARPPMTGKGAASRLCHRLCGSGLRSRKKCPKREFRGV